MKLEAKGAPALVASLVLHPKKELSCLALKCVLSLLCSGIAAISSYWQILEVARY